MITPSTAVLGLLVSIITEALKYIPVLSYNALTKALTAIVVLAVGVFVTTGTFDFTTFVGALVFALTSYTAIVQPVAKVTGLRTQ